MPRTYGTTNIAPYASAPAVGPAGDTYYNTASKITYVSDGTQWNALQGAGGGGGGAPYAPVTGTAPPPAAPVITPPTGLLWVDLSTTPSWQPSVGPAGPGVPAGGAAGTYLQKRSTTDYDTQWAGLPNLIYYQTVPPIAAGTSYTVTHNLGTAYLHVQLWDAVTGLQVGAQVQILNVNNIQISVTQTTPNNINVVVVGTANVAAPVNPGDIASKSYVDARTPNLPAPVTTGTTIQSFTDALGDVWVAKNGVNGGAWRRARDVVNFIVGRSAAYTYSTSGVNMPFNAVQHDVYGLYDTVGNQFIPPVPGVYQLESMLGATFTAASQFLAIASAGFRTNVYSSAAYNTYGHLHGQVFLAAGQNIAITAYTSVALACIANTVDSYFHMAYLGTG